MGSGGSGWRQLLAELLRTGQYSTISHFGGPPWDGGGSGGKSREKMGSEWRQLCGQLPRTGHSSTISYFEVPLGRGSEWWGVKGVGWEWMAPTLWTVAPDGP